MIGPAPKDQASIGGKVFLLDGQTRERRAPANAQTNIGVEPMRNLSSYFVATMLLLAACSRGLDGEYTDESGMFTYSFKSGGKVEITTKVMGMLQTQEMDYKLEEGKVKVGTAGGPQQVMPIDKDGCLEAGGLIGKLCKKKKS
jgi:hypothetical protein